MARPLKTYRRPGPRKNANYWINEAVIKDFQQWCHTRGIIPSEITEDLLVALMDGTLTIDVVPIAPKD